MLYDASGNEVPVVSMRRTCGFKQELVPNDEQDIIGGVGPKGGGKVWVPEDGYEAPLAR